MVALNGEPVTVLPTNSPSKPINTNTSSGSPNPIPVAAAVPYTTSGPGGVGSGAVSCACVIPQTLRSAAATKNRLIRMTLLVGFMSCVPPRSLQTADHNGRSWQLRLRNQANRLWSTVFTYHNIRGDAAARPDIRHRQAQRRQCRARECHADDRYSLPDHDVVGVRQRNEG